MGGIQKRYWVLRRWEDRWKSLYPEQWGKVLCVGVWACLPDEMRFSGFEDETFAYKEGRRLNFGCDAWVWEVEYVTPIRKIKLYQPLKVFPARKAGKSGSSDLDKAIERASQFWSGMVRTFGTYELEMVVSLLKKEYEKYVL